MPLVRWTLYDPTNDQTITFPYNPREGGLPDRVKKLDGTTTTQGETVVWEGNPGLQYVTISGVILDHAHHEFFDTWFDLDHEVIVTDHLGRRARVYLSELKRTPRNRTNNKWSAQLTAQMLFLGWAD